MSKYPLLIGTSTRPAAGAPATDRARILIDGREVPGLVSADPERSMAIVHQLDSDGNPITGPDGTPVLVRRAGKIEILL